MDAGSFGLQTRKGLSSTQSTRISLVTSMSTGYGTRKIASGCITAMMEVFTAGVEMTKVIGIGWSGELDTISGHKKLISGLQKTCTPIMQRREGDADNSVERTL